MAPFLLPKLVISGIKERIESLTVHADRLYIGTSVGSLHIYSINEDKGDEGFPLVEVKKNLTRRSIDQLGYIKEINSLVVLSESMVTLFPLPTFAPPTPLVKAKSAFSFAVNTVVEHILPDAKSEQSMKADFNKVTAIPTLVTQLLVGCQRRAVLYTWKDGEAQGIQEAPLPHSPRVITYLNQDTTCFAYAPDYAIFSIPTMSATDISIPLPITASGSAMGALSGITGYMSLGLGAKAKPRLIQVGDTEALIVKDNEGLFIGADAKPSRPVTMEWLAPPDEIAFVKPYVFSVLPPGTLPVSTTVPSSTIVQNQQPFITTTAVQIRSSLSLQISQTLPFPFTSTSDSTAPPSNATVRLLTASSSAKSPLFLVTTPTDRSTATAEGSSIWQFTMKPWSEQIDELVATGEYADALTLLNTIDGALLPDKDQRSIRIRALNAVSQFREEKFDAAIDAFIELDLNPAKVVALYPDSVAGRLSVPQERWIPLYGGPSPPPDDTMSAVISQGSDTDKDSIKQEKAASELLDAIPSGSTSIRKRLQQTGLGMFVPSGRPKDDDTASIISKRKFGVHGDQQRSIEELVRFLTERRPKLFPALQSVGITPENQFDHASPLSEAPVEELFALPNTPLSVLTPEQLLRFAQIVDTALYKAYLIIRPGLLRPLCRQPNWCEVTEVEEDLRARQKFAELGDLYHGKKMHAKALDLLHELSEKEKDLEDKLGPSISYLQKLGPEYLSQIFESSRWIFDIDADMAFEIFTSEDVELPRHLVADYLENINPKICTKYLEFIIEEREEINPAFHDRLVELYLSMTLAAKRHSDESSRNEVYSKLLEFIESNYIYSIDRLYGHISSTDLFEARAILLGRLGRHDQALELYVYRLQDYLKAEEYCKHIYRPNSETSGVFFTLLRIYLRPSPQIQPTPNLLQPALDLIHRHNPRLDPVETLQLLPPLVTAEDVKAFLVEALRAPIFDTKVVKHISKARNEQLARKLVGLQARRVKVTDSRICPQCHKRLGNSVIAVHAPRGEVTHYQCRELFSRRLNEKKA